MRTKNTTPNYTCIHCGDPFYRKRNTNNPPKFCSILCSNRHSANARAKECPREAQVIGGGIAVVPLTKGLTATIDESDLPLIGGYRWHASRSGSAFYARTSASNDLRGIQMHRLITGVMDGLQVDHINGDTLDNRRSNLRIVDGAANMRSWALRALPNKASKFTGVYRGKGFWYVRLHHNGKNLYIGKFSDEVEAAIAYDNACEEYRGYRVNFA